jgi:hypothetical protein
VPVGVSASQSLLLVLRLLSQAEIFDELVPVRGERRRSGTRGRRRQPRRRSTPELAQMRAVSSASGVASSSEVRSLPRGPDLDRA